MGDSSLEDSWSDLGHRDIIREVAKLVGQGGADEEGVGSRVARVGSYLEVGGLEEGEAKGEKTRE